MNPRRRARESALQVLYATDLTDRWHEPPEEGIVPSEPRTSGEMFARRILDGVFRERQAIDGAIQSAARHWHLSRMNLVDRNLLRIAAFEILYCADVPGKVAINEALELAKAYGEPETRRFLNGILDKIVRERAGGG